MKAWSRAQHAQEREAGLYAHHQAEAELISSYLNSQQAVEAAVAAVSSSNREPYGVPIPPPLLPHEHPDLHPLPPQRSSSSAAGGGQQKSRGKRSRHAGTTASSNSRPSASAASGDIHYPKYDLYGYKYSSAAPQPDQCQYTTKYGEDCHYKYSNSAASSAAATAGSASTGCAYNKTWPKQHCTDEEGRVYTQDDHQVQYVDQYGLQHQQQQQQPPRSKKTRKQQHRDRSPQQQAVNPDFPCFSSREREYLVSTGHYQAKASDPIPAIEEVGRYIEQAESRAKSVKDIARDLAKDRAALCSEQDQFHQDQQQPQQQQQQQPPEAPPPPPAAVASTMESSQTSTNLQTFNPQASTKAEVQLQQQEQIQYVDSNESCCKEAAAASTGADQNHHQSHHNNAATLPRRAAANHPQNKSKTGTMSTAQMNAQFGTLERNMAEVAERNRQSRAELGASGQTLDRSRSAFAQSCDTCDAPLTPASLAGIDHRDLEHRPLTRSVTRATVYDEPPEKTSLFITCSGLYGLFLVVVCVAFLAAEIATHSVPLHYFEGLFTYLYIASILFLLYTFCFLLHEYSCCGGPPQPTVRNAYFHNLPRDALPDGSPVREKLANFKRPKKFKTSEADFSHGSFFLRIGAITFGLGTMIYNGLELGSFFEIPWTSPCYQVLRGINPILQMVFTFSQMYFVFMNARLNIHKFKCIARFGLMHIVATNLCVWMRTVVKECTKEIANYRVNRGHGVSEDYMILEGYNTLRRKFGGDSFLVNGPYTAIMNAFTPADGTEGSYWGFNFPGFSGSGNEGPMTTTLPSTAALAQAYQQAPPNQNYNAAPYYSQTISPMAGANNVLMNNRFANNHGVINIANNFTCGRNYIMGDIVSMASPYLYPFVVEYSLIAAAVIFAMWSNIGNNPRYKGEDDDRMSVASRKMTAYAKTDCVGASKGLFFGLLTLVLGLICLILFFVLIDHDNQQVSQLAVFLADSSHCAILLASILAIFLGFLRVQKLKFHGEEQSVLGDFLLRFAAIGMFAYSTFNIVAGGLGVHSDLKNLLVLATGGISIIQVILQLLFITDAQRRRIHSSDHNSSKPGRQVVTFLLICNITMWIIYTFEVQKVKDSPVQLRFFGFYAWSVIQRICLPLCIFFRFHSSVILVEIWKNSYKTKLMD